MAPRANISDQALIELFLDMLAAERGGARNTLAAYARDLADFSALPRRSPGARSPTPRPTTCAAIWVRSPSAASPPPRWRGGSRRSASSTASSTRRDSAPTIPPPSSKGPKRGRSLPKVLSIAEVDRLLTESRAAIGKAAEPAPERLRAARLACLIEVLYATGLRVSELVALPISAAERNARMLVVRGKGDKERLVPLNEAAKTTMRDYLALLADAGPRRRNRNGCFPRSARAAT